MSKSIALQSGNTLVFTFAPFREASRLMALVRQAAIKSKMIEHLDLLEKIEGKDLNKLDAPTRRKAIEVLEEYTTLLIGDPDIEDAIFACFKGCTYNGNALTLELFEDVEARGDFDEIKTHVMEENLRAFQTEKKTPSASANTKAGQG